MLTQEDKAKIQLQMDLERAFNSNQLIPRIRKEFTDFKEFDFAEYAESRGIPERFAIDVLTQMALHKRCTLPILVAIMNNHLGNAQATVDMLELCARADLMDWEPVTKMFVVKFTIRAEVQEEIDKYQFPLPMVVEPKTISNNKETGYYTSGGSLLLKKNHHDEDICLDHINRMNKVKFALNLETVNLVRNSWRNLDKPKPGETKADFEKRKKAFEKYDRTSREVIARITSHVEEFHLTHRYDKRGRTYCQGYHISYQGTAWNKAVIHLAEGELTV